MGGLTGSECFPAIRLLEALVAGLAASRVFITLVEVKGVDDSTGSTGFATLFAMRVVAVSSVVDGSNSPVDSASVVWIHSEKSVTSHMTKTGLTGFNELC